MQKRIAFKNMAHSDVLEKFANEKLKKIEQLLDNERLPITINLVIEGASTHAHNKVELLVSTADFHLIAKHEGSDLYFEINKVMDKMLEEVRSAKEKKADKHKKGDTFKGA